MNPRWRRQWFRIVMNPDDWEEEASQGGAGRPGDVELAVKLLAGSVAFNMVKIFALWSRLGLTWVVAHRGAWVRPAALAACAVLIALIWKGSSWARNMVLVAIGWDVLGILSAASLLFAIGGSRLLGILSWVNVVVELSAAYLLLQEDSLDWFRKQT